jgi:hypothetical protein
MRKFIRSSILAFLALALTLAIPGFADTAENPYTVPLITQGNRELGPVPVGEIRIWNDTTHLYIQYILLNAEWRLIRTSIHISNNSEGLYHKRSFLHSNNYEQERIHRSLRKYTHKIPIHWVAPRGLLIAADAELIPINGYASDAAAFARTLPHTVSLSAIHPSPDLKAYSQATIVEGDFLDGFHYSWCVDLDRKIEQNRWYHAEVYSLFDEMPRGFLEFPENLDLVNWILNADFVGRPSPSGGKYTYGDIQRLIWDLLDNENISYGLDPWSQQRVDEIHEKALANGEGFIPNCNQEMMVVLVPVGKNRAIIAQPIAITIPVPCIPATQTATAAIRTIYRSDNKWGSIFVSPIRHP